MNTNIASATPKGFNAMAHRIVNAENKFIEAVRTVHGRTQAEAEKVLRVYRKLKLIKIDAVGGGFTLTHGIYFEADVIENAVNHAEKFNR